MSRAMHNILTYGHSLKIPAINRSNALTYATCYILSMKFMVLDCIFMYSNTIMISFDNMLPINWLVTEHCISDNQVDFQHIFKYEQR